MQHLSDEEKQARIIPASVPPEERAAVIERVTSTIKAGAAYTAERHHRDYRMVWSPEDNEYVAMSLDYPSLSWLDPDPDKAVAGLIQLLQDIEDDPERELPEPVDRLQAMRDRLTKLAAEIPLGERRGTAMQFLEELERGEALQIEAERLMRVPMAEEEWRHIFDQIRHDEGRDDISANDFIQAIIKARNTTFEKARAALYQLFETGEVELTNSWRIRLIENPNQG